MNQTNSNPKLEKLLTKIAENVAVIQSRLKSLEENSISKMEVIRLRNDLNKIETKMAAMDGHILQVEDRVVKEISATNANVIKVAKKLDKKFIELFDYLDGDVMKQAKRLKEIEHHLGLDIN